MDTATVSRPVAAASRELQKETALEEALSSRDRALLRAVDAGRCVLAGLQGMVLRIDGMGCADQFAGARLAAAGLIATTASGLSLTAAGRAAIGPG